VISDWNFRTEICAIVTGTSQQSKIEEEREEQNTKTDNPKFSIIDNNVLPHAIPQIKQKRNLCCCSKAMNFVREENVFDISLSLSLLTTSTKQ
jgi:hypothetical protein